MPTRQKNPLIWTFAIACVLSLGFLSPWTGNAVQEKKDLCHRTGNGSYTIITIAEPAWQTHYDHGDIDVITFYEDNDGDGFGTTASTEEACEPLVGYAEVAGDCDDQDAAVNPGAPEVVGNGIDDDCNPNTPDQAPPVASCPCEGLTNAGVTWGSEFTVRFCGRITVPTDPGDYYGACDQETPDASTQPCHGHIGVYTFGPDAYINCHVGGSGPGGYQALTIDAAQRDACVESIMRLAEEDGVECPTNPY